MENLSENGSIENLPNPVKDLESSEAEANGKNFHDENQEDTEYNDMTDNERDDQISELNNDLEIDNSSPNNTLFSQAVDELFFRQRKNLAHELRQLRYSSRLVTSDFGQDARVRLENFLKRATGDSTNVTSQNVSRYRSPDILNEISQLNSVQRVSAILNSNLRSNIESSLRNSNNRRDQSNSNINAHSLPQTGNSETRNQNPIVTIPPDFDLLNREAIIEEISDLVHRQLVSNTLQSEFRTVLEERVLERLRQSGTDGNQTRQLIQELSRQNNSNIIRNDFSNLGIYSGRIRSNSSASSSVINESINMASRLTIKNNSKEIKELKAEIKELKSLVKLSFELTLDIQRSFKQEISALISNTFHNSNIAKSSLLNPVPANEGYCIICTESKIDTVFYECGHMATCYTCSMNLKHQNHSCPVCRAPIKDIIRSYKANPN